MADLSFTLSKALAAGRSDGFRPGTREEVLLRLLRKRAAAQRAGLDDQAESLRAQIRWALPMRDGEAEAR